MILRSKLPSLPFPEVSNCWLPPSSFTKLSVAPAPCVWKVKKLVVSHNTCSNSILSPASVPEESVLFKRKALPASVGIMWLLSGVLSISKLFDIVSALSEIILSPSVSSTRTPNSPAWVPWVIEIPSKSIKLRGNVSLTNL